MIQSCAKVIKFCIRGVYEKFDLAVIGKNMNVQKCKKERIEMTSTKQTAWQSEKRMFLCPSSEICIDNTCYRPTPAIHISAGGLINSALIFQKEKNEDKSVKPIYYVENLDFETSESKLIPLAKKEGENPSLKEGALPKKDEKP